MRILQHSEIRSFNLTRIDFLLLGSADVSTANAVSFDTSCSYHRFCCTCLVAHGSADGREARLFELHSLVTGDHPLDGYHLRMRRSRAPQPGTKLKHTTMR
eukprot:767688-Hanusia_phi.AAC.5